MKYDIIPYAVPLPLIRAAEAAWPEPTWPHWHRYNNATSNKFGSMDRCRIPPACLAVLDALALAVSPYIGESFIDYDLHGAGMHMMPPGGFLGRHLDAEVHPLRPWRRTHSVVLGVNTAWGELCGGELVLEGDPSQTITMTAGQAVVFETKNQWHEVLRVNTDVTLCHRKTLALFAWDYTWRHKEGETGSTSAHFEAGPS